MKESAGILMFCRMEGEIHFLLAHPGGPFFAKKNEGAWTIPKGLLEKEEPEAAAKREFEEETGIPVPEGEALLSLGTARLKSGKRIHCFAVEGRPDAIKAFNSNTFELEWPPKSGKTQVFPEIDRIGWFSSGEAARLLNPAQTVFVTRLLALFQKQNPR